LDLSGNTLYGAASSGGAHGSGTVYKVNTDGTGFTTMHSLNSLTDGTEPAATLVLAGSTLFGTALGGGGAFGGTVFKINTDDSGFSNVYNGIQYGSQGGQPQGMILSGQTLYGTLHVGAAGSAGGTVFKLNTNGAGFTNLCSFAGLTNGAGPNGGLILSGNTLYGTAVAGGANGNGTVFKVNTDGTGFAGLYNFTTLQNAVSNTDGALPRAGLILSGGSVYGTASAGGAAGNGTVFSFSLGPALTIILSGTNAILSWPANAGVFDYSGFTLQSTTNPVALAVWTTVSPPPALVNGQNTVTNPISGTEQFYRLSQ
jgi:uncharacterized repeat protein (TIGR03803 family)